MRPRSRPVASTLRSAQLDSVLLLPRRHVRLGQRGCKPSIQKVLDDSSERSQSVSNLPQLGISQLEEVLGLHPRDSPTR